MDLTYYELNDDQGIESDFLRSENGLEYPNPRAGELAPLNNIGIQIPVPVQADDGETVMTTRRAPILPGEQLDEHLHARIIPGTRIVEVAHPAVVNLLIETGRFHQIDPPADLRPRVLQEQADGGSDEAPTKRRKASDGTFINVPSTVEVGVTPGWPVDGESGKPLNLTDEQREHLAAADLQTPNDVSATGQEREGIDLPADGVIRDTPIHPDNTNTPTGEED